MQDGDPDTMIGGPGVAYNINNDRSSFPTNQRPNGGDMMVGAANHSLPVDFFTFHDVQPCMDQPKCNVTDVRPPLTPTPSCLRKPELLLDVPERMIVDVSVARKSFSGLRFPGLAILRQFWKYHHLRRCGSVKKSLLCVAC